MLTIDPAIIEALKSETIHHAWLLEVAEAFFWTTHGSDVTVNLGQGDVTFASVGKILTVPTISRNKEIRQHGLTLALDGVENDIYQALSNNVLVGRSCRLSLAVLDKVGNVIGDQAINMYEGTFDSWSFRDAGSAEQIDIKIIGPWSKPDQTAGRFTSDSSQQEYSPGDKFMQFAHVELENLPWGEKD